MELIIGLCLVGIALIALEVFVPGGILGIAGFCILIGAAIVAYQEYQVAGALATIGLCSVACIGVLVFEFKYLPKTKYGKRLMLLTSNKSTSAAPIAAEDILGKKGEAVTRLNPTGVVRIEDKEYECFCEDGQVEAGTQVEVLKRESFRLVVGIAD